MSDTTLPQQDKRNREKNARYTARRGGRRRADAVDAADTMPRCRATTPRAPPMLGRDGRHKAAIVQPSVCCKATATPTRRAAPLTQQHTSKREGYARSFFSINRPCTNCRSPSEMTLSLMAARSSQALALFRWRHAPLATQNQTPRSEVHPTQTVFPRRRVSDCRPRRFVFGVRGSCATLASAPRLP